jgi:hypothetical protein
LYIDLNYFRYRLQKPNMACSCPFVGPRPKKVMTECKRGTPSGKRGTWWWGSRERRQLADADFGNNYKILCVVLYIRSQHNETHPPNTV